MGLSEVGAPLKISDASISKHYLTLVARDLLMLAMNQTPENTDFNRKKLLDYALPSAFSELDEALKIRSDRLKRLRASTFFAIDSMSVDEKALVLTVDGYLLHYIGKKETARQKTRVTLALEPVAGRLFLKALTVESINRHD